MIENKYGVTLFHTIGSLDKYRHLNMLYWTSSNETENKTKEKENNCQLISIFYCIPAQKSLLTN